MLTEESVIVEDVCHCFEQVSDIQSGGFSKIIYTILAFLIQLKLSFQNVHLFEEKWRQHIGQHAGVAGITL